MTRELQERENHGWEGNLRVGKAATEGNDGGKGEKKGKRSEEVLVRGENYVKKRKQCWE